MRLRPAPMIGEVGDFGVAAQRGLRMALEVGAQQRLELGLVEHVGLGVAVPGAGRVALELRQDRHSRVQQSQSERRPGDLRELVGDAQSIEDAVHLVVEVNRTGLGVHVGPAVEDEAFDAVLGEQGGSGDARRPGTDDHDRTRSSTRSSQLLQ